MTEFREPVCHAILIDGTFASLDPGHRSSVGRIYAALSGWWGKLPARVRVRYTPGLQWEKLRTVPDLVMGAELEGRIRLSYGWLTRSWQPGDPLFLFGYSRGAFAVRSLAGMIGLLGLIRSDLVTDQLVRRAWSIYRDGAPDDEIAAFRERYCHADVPIRMVGVFDTVTALGIRLPLLWMMTEPRYHFHDQHLGPNVELGFQALALDETRAAFQPIRWTDEPADGRITQMWFRGCHADIGGQLAGAEYARPLANIPLVWMMEQAEAAGLPLPNGWKYQLTCDPTAPSLGSWRGWGKAFIARAPRTAGTEPTETLHPTVPVPYPGPAILIGDLAQYALYPPQPRKRRGRDTTPPDAAPNSTG